MTGLLVASHPVTQRGVAVNRCANRHYLWHTIARKGISALAARPECLNRAKMATGETGALREAAARLAEQLHLAAHRFSRARSARLGPRQPAPVMGVCG